MHLCGKPPTVHITNNNNEEQGEGGEEPAEHKRSAISEVSQSETSGFKRKQAAASGETLTGWTDTFPSGFVATGSTDCFSALATSLVKHQYAILL